MVRFITSSRWPYTPPRARRCGSGSYVRERRGLSKSVSATVYLRFTSARGCSGTTNRRRDTSPSTPTRQLGSNCGLQSLEEAGIAQMVEHHAEESQIALPRFLGE